jgi:hypothetical protein
MVLIISKGSCYSLLSGLDLLNAPRVKTSLSAQHIVSVQRPLVASETFGKLREASVRLRSLPCG